MLQLFLLILLSFPFSSLADEKVSVYWDCVLARDVHNARESEDTGCIEIKLAYFSNPSVKETSEDKADLHLTIRELPLNNETEYQFTTRWKGGEAYFWPGLRLNSTLSHGEITEKIISFLGQLTAPYIRIANNGNSTTVNEKDVPYYFSPMVHGAGSKQQGSSSISGALNLNGNYSTPSWRVLGGAYGGYRKDAVNTTAFNPGITSQISYGGGYAGTVRDLGKVGNGRWDIAIFISDKTVVNDLDIDSEENHFPANALYNKARKTSIAAGTEWIAVPFLTETSKGNISVRYSIGLEQHKYISPQNFEAMKETFAKHTLQVYLSRHFPKVDVGFSASAFNSSFRTEKLVGISGASIVTYKINPRMTIGANASLTYAQNRVMSPAEGSMSFMGLTSGTTPLTYNGNVSLTYTLGNIRIFNKEQRWKD